MFFVLVQLLGFIGWGLSVLSYWKKEINGILYFQLIAGIFYALHYYFLGAVVGFLIIIFEFFRDFFYYKSDLDKYIFIATLPFYIVFGFLIFDGIVSLYPVIASIVEGFGLAVKKNVAVVGAIVSAALWLVYDYMAGSYVGMIACVILLFSNVIVFIKDSEKVCIKIK